jgi:hypothetical protein
MGDRLERPDRAAELFALARVVERKLEHAARTASIAGGCKHPL